MSGSRLPPGSQSLETCIVIITWYDVVIITLYDFVIITWYDIVIIGCDHHLVTVLMTECVRIVGRWSVMTS